MKPGSIRRDRAGTVGRKGVGPLLKSLLRGTAARLHLIGHSCGTKVMLSALCASNAPTRKVHSMLLLQPAVSHLCFADIVAGSHRPGGYRQALSRVTHPIFSTYSSLDNDLRMYFHLFPRRRRDKGEYDTAALQMATPAPPSLFAALGGYGPRHAGEDFVPMKAIPNPYQLNPTIPIYGLDGSNGQITGHGKIANPYTWWALYSLVSRP